MAFAGDQAADVDVANALKAERREGALHRLALRVKDARLGSNQDAGAHHALVRSSQVSKA